MPPLPGESLLLNIFADVHYYFDQPSVKPVHHRFDRASYVYLYHNAIQGRTRLEVANAAGTPDQDAFNGYLDTAVLTNSYKQPTLFSVAVEGAKPASTSPRPADHSQWHLPAFDQKNEQKYLYKIHTLDLYVWTEKDADLLVDSIRRVIHPQQLNITEAPPPPEHDGSMSPVVQQLERIAVATPPHARAQSSVSNQSGYGVVNRTPEGHASTPYHPSAAPVPAPVVVPYNPAAPSAPEPIAHREKTPPPMDAVDGTGLSDTAVHEYPSQYRGQLPHFAQTHPQQTMFPGPPQRTTSIQSLPPPPPPPGQTPLQAIPRTPSFAAPLPSSQPYTPVPQSYTPASQPQYATYPTQQAHYPQSPGFPTSTTATLPQTPGFHPSTPGLPPTPGHLQPYTGTPLASPTFPQSPLQSPGLPPPPAMPGYSNYTYAAQPQTQPQPQTQAQQNSQVSQDIYAVHGQAYRPTEAEAAHGQVPKAQQKQGGLEQRMGRMEKGVGRFLRKLDQKI